MPTSSDLGIINEKVTSRHAWTLVNEVGVGLAPGDLDTLVLTIYEEDTGTVVNSVTTVNIKNTGRGALDSSGNLVLTLLPADNQCITTKGREVHILLVEWTYAATVKAGRHEGRLTILNLAKVT